VRRLCGRVVCGGGSVKRIHVGSMLLLISIVAVSCRAIGGASSSASRDAGTGNEPASSSTPSPQPSVYPEIIWYAEDFGLSLEEAIRRTDIMQEFDNVPLLVAVGDRWAGGWIEHEPEFRYVIRLTGEGWEEFGALAAEMPLPIHFIDGAAHSESQMLAAMGVVQDRLITDGHEMAMGTDLKTGSIVIYGPDEPRAGYLAELAALTGVPVRYENSPLPEPL